MAAMVCAECTIFKKAFESFGGDYSEEETQRTPFEDLASLERSALLGCSLCQIIYQTWHYERYSEIYKEDSPIHVKGYIWDEDDSENGTEDSSESKIQGIYICYEGSTTGFTLSDFTDGRISEEAFGAYQNASRQIIDPNTPDSVGKIASLASAWILNCRQTHQNCSCHAKRVPKVLPTRLIDVGTDVPDQPPKLFVPLRHLRSLEYIALSYAWGTQGNFIKTTSSNLKAMIQSLPWAQLPKTIQDAIAVTRRLGVRYLWVDALCILQSEGPDDMKHKEDWSYEAARFGQYYQNSLLTIAATGASSSNDGLLLPRLILRFEPKSITFRPGKAAPLRYTIRSRIPSWLSDTYFSPLSKRGWAIQERLLSRRVLHFAENMILWECHDCRATELDPQGLDPIAEDLNLLHIEFITKCRDLYAKGLESDDFADEWYNFVTTYSASDFTFVSDRLPALSGIAAIIQQHTQQKYIAGLWESDIPRGLAWMTSSSFRFETSHLVDPQTIGKPAKGDSRLMLPSWCWAVSKGMATPFCQFGWTPSVQVESWEADSQGTSTSGQLRGARLTVRGCLTMLKLADLGFVPHARTDIADHVLVRDPKKYSTNPCVMVCMDSTVDSKSRYLSHPCLLIGSTNMRVFDGTTQDISRQATGGAIILEATGRCLGIVKEYRRIGFICLPVQECLSIFNNDMITVDLV